MGFFRYLSGVLSFSIYILNLLKYKVTTSELVSETSAIAFWHDSEKLGKDDGFSRWNVPLVAARQQEQRPKESSQVVAGDVVYHSNGLSNGLSGLLMQSWQGGWAAGVGSSGMCAAGWLACSWVCDCVRCEAGPATEHDCRCRAAAESSSCWGRVAQDCVRGWATCRQRLDVWLKELVMWLKASAGDGATEAAVYEGQQFSSHCGSLGRPVVNGPCGGQLWRMISFRIFLFQ